MVFSRFPLAASYWFSDNRPVLDHRLQPVPPLVVGEVVVEPVVVDGGQPVHGIVPIVVTHVPAGHAPQQVRVPVVVAVGRLHCRVADQIRRRGGGYFAYQPVVVVQGIRHPVPTGILLIGHIVPRVVKAAGGPDERHGGVQRPVLIYGARPEPCGIAVIIVGIYRPVAQLVRTRRDQLMLVVRCVGIAVPLVFRVHCFQQLVSVTVAVCLVPVRVVLRADQIPLAVVVIR